MYHIFVSNNADALEAKLNDNGDTVTIEAEYGARLVEGSLLILAHHGERSGNPAPCIADVPDLSDRDWLMIGVSHIDLDTLGGIAAVLGRKPKHAGFWNCAAWVDVNGPHKLLDCPDFNDIIGLMLDAFWAYSENNRVFPPRDGSVLEIDAQVEAYLNILTRIIAFEDDLIEEGRQFRKTRRAEEQDALIEEGDDVRVFCGPKFCNAFYRGAVGVAKGVVAYNTRFGSITVSLEDGGKSVNARELVQGLWGNDAGGHDGIAGSPRGTRMSLNDLVNARDALIVALKQ